VIPDTAGDARYRDVPTVTSLGVAAYVGVPIVIGGQVIGAFCTIDMKPRDWTADEVEILVELSASAQREIELRSAVAIAESANRSKSDFLAMMSHELRTPLNAIGGYAALVEEGLAGPVTSLQRSYLARVKNGQQHLLGLINGILTYAQIDAGAVHYASDLVEVDAAIAVAESLTTPQIRAKGLTFEHRIHSPALSVIGDREKIQQIMVNLLSNAIKFTDSMGAIAVSSRMLNDQVAIDVSDTGCGIAADQVSRVFEPFVQVGTDPKATRQGTGLGLAISREFARAMNGGLTAHSEVGVGTRMTLVLPAA
jgi:signal transduction histidine kinase